MFMRQFILYKNKLYIHKQVAAIGKSSSMQQNHNALGIAEEFSVELVH